MLSRAKPSCRSLEDAHSDPAIPSTCRMNLLSSHQIAIPTNLFAYVSIICHRYYCYVQSEVLGRPGNVMISTNTNNHQKQKWTEITHPTHEKIAGPLAQAQRCPSVIQKLTLSQVQKKRRITTIPNSKSGAQSSVHLLHLWVKCTEVGPTLERMRHQRQTPGPTCRNCRNWGHRLAAAIAALPLRALSE